MHVRTNNYEARKINVVFNGVASLKIRQKKLIAQSAKRIKCYTANMVAFEKCLTYANGNNFLD